MAVFEVFTPNLEKKIRNLRIIENHIFEGEVETKLETHVPSADAATLSIIEKMGIVIAEPQAFYLLLARAQNIDYSSLYNDDVALALTFYGIAEKISG